MVRAPSDTRERILLAAAELWHANSYDAIGVAEICAAAKAQKGSFFHFFKTKEDLAVAVLRLHRERGKAAVEACFSERDVPPLDRLRRFTESMQQTMVDAQASGAARGCPIGNLASELATRLPAVRAEAASIFEALRGAFRTVLDEAVACGDLASDADTDRLAGTLLAQVQGLALLGKTFENAERVLPLGEHVLDVLLIDQRS